MYIRVNFLKMEAKQKAEARRIYNDEVIPVHKEHKGCRFVHLLECLDNEEDGMTLTAWDTREDVENYEKSGDYEKMLSRFKGFISEEPVQKHYEITASSEPLILRIF